MSGLTQQESQVKESLFQFINKNVPGADISVIDECVLSYVISILEEASQDPCFDVDGFIEIMAAYIPEFSRIDPGLVCTWVLQLEAEMNRPKTGGHNYDDDDKISLTLQSLSEMLPSVNKPRSQSNSISSEGTDESPREARAAGEGRAADEDQLAAARRALHEMFPDTTAIEIKHCVTIAGGDVERAAATVLARRDIGQSLHHQQPIHQQPIITDHELKNRIIARYSYVDKNSETKEHKPLAPKIEPKKLVRYRDNKIVSLKGERYTEVPKSGIDEEHLKKPKKQHCP